MEFGEDGEEIAVEGGGIGDAGITEQERKDGGHGDPQDHPGDKMRGAGSVEALDEKTGEERRILCFAPGHDAKQAGLQRDVEDGDSQDREENSARNVFFGLADFATEMADVVVAPVAVDGFNHSGAESREPKRREVKSAGGKIKCKFGIEM